MLKSLPKQTRTQLASDCRAPTLTELPSVLQRFAGNHNKSFGALFLDNKSKYFENASKSDSQAKSDEKKKIPQCSHCKKNGHLDTDCFIKHPEKRRQPKKEQNINNFNKKETPPDAIEIKLEGSINGIPCTNILFDTGAHIPAFHPRLLNDVKPTKKTKLNCLSKYISLGIFDMVELPISTTIFDGSLEGVVVDNLNYDAVLPIIKNDKIKSITVDLATASVNVQSTLSGDMSTPSGDKSTPSGDKSTPSGDKSTPSLEMITNPNHDLSTNRSCDMKFFPNSSDEMSTFTSIGEAPCAHKRDVLADDNHSLVQSTVNSSKLANNNFLANTNDDNNLSIQLLLKF